MAQELRVDQRIYNRKGTAIPTDHVLTPGGYRHKDFVHQLEGGSIVRRRKRRIQLVERRTNRIRHVLSEPDPSNGTPSLGSGWISYAEWQNVGGTPISRVCTTWEVPNSPAVSNGQTVFLFNALQDLARNDIVQPVLQWGESAAGGGPGWWITNWYIDTSGYALYHPLISVQPGTQLTGIIVSVQNANSFNYSSQFVDPSQTVDYGSVDLSVREIGELVWAATTLEAYQIGDCGDYPDQPQTSMTGIELDIGNATPYIGWTASTVANACNLRAGTSNFANPGGQFDIYYR